tara:strand:- start:7450 stop:8223 length:774 start_codon:yes stop_codon:yes gene_type:complete
MITVLSPAKKLSKECFAHSSRSQRPAFLNESEELISILKVMAPPELMSLMGISENLATLNWERFQSWGKEFKVTNSRESVYSFMGDTYTGLDSKSLSEKDIKFAEKNVRILSGLHGILRPLDLMMPYRLEMGTKLKNKAGDSLYDYWGDTLTRSLNNELESHQQNVVINCASVEYFKSINRPTLQAEIITPHFKELKNGKMKIISFFAKRARGMMARYIIQNQIKDKKDILAFDLGGYSFDPTLSLPNEPVFTRAQA